MTRLLNFTALIALFIALPLHAHSREDAPATLIAPAAEEVVAGNISALVIEDRRTGETRSHYGLERADGSIVPLTGPAAAALQDGARVMARGTHNGDQFAVQSIQQLSPPSPSLMTAKAANATQVEGTLAIAHADDFATGRSTYLYHVQDDAGMVTELSVASLPAELRGGMRVIVSGQRSADGSSLHPQRITILSGPGPSSTTSQDLVAKSVTTNTVLVILANFNNTTAPAFTSAQAQQVMSSNSNSVANYYSEVSYGQQVLNVTVTSSWVTMNLAGTCSYTSISSAANAAALAANPTYNASNYNFVVYLFPAQGCGWLGLAYVGFPHQAFINGTSAFTTQVIGHEMGHNFGLYHAGSLSCGSAAVGGSCNVAEYGDPWDTMGNQRAMHFNAAQKSLLGWIPASSVKTHTSGSASYTLSPLEQSGAAVYAVKIPTSNANRTYWLEFRQPIGFDAPLASYPNNGAQIRVARPFEWSAGSDDTEIVDMTPGSGGGFTDSALVAGQSFLDSATGVNIIVTSATASALTVSVSKSGGTAVATTLASSANPSTVGASITLTASVTGSSLTGSVNFKDGSLSISGCSAVALSGSGNTRTAACVTSSLVVGTHSIVAAYSGDSTNAASSSNVLSQTVSKVSSTTGIASSLNPSTFGASVTFTATVTGSSPTGSVNFTDGGSSISGCSAASLAGSGNIRTATCVTSTLAAGTHSIIAAYGGDGANTASTSVALSQTVNSSGSSSTTTALVNPSFETPALSSGYQYNPAGTGVGWTFSSNSGIQANGSAWGAALAPDGRQTAFIQSTGTIAQTVSLNAGSYTLSFQAARRNCCVSPYAQPVKVTVDGIQIGSLVSPASTSFSAVSIPFSVATSGAHTIRFAGTDGTDKTTFIDAVALTAGGGTVTTATTTTLGSSLNPSTASAGVTFTASVTGNAPTGNVAFTDGGSAISGCAAAALSGSGNTRTAACSTASLAAGTHSIVAAYAGDAANAASTSSALSQTVNSVAVSLVNPGFETPTLASGGYQYNPTGTGVGWTFGGTTGLQSNGSAWGAAAAPDGRQTAFVQRTGSISQTVSLSAGSYTLSFQVAQRACCAAPNVQPVKVTVDGTQVGSLVSPASTSFSVVSISFSVATSGAHTIAFTGTDSQDKTTFIDAVTIH